MNLLGDVPDKDRKIAAKLTDYEKHVDSDDTFPNERKAQCYVCLAHDWYQIGLEEEGNRLLLKAEHTFPGYFKKSLIKHAAESKDFDRLVKSFTVELMWMLIGQLNERKAAKE